MARVNELIVQRLRKFPPAVRDAAITAVEFATTHSEKDVAEHLNGIIKNLVRQRGENP